ncbi:hypothetical protein Bbelb_175410 [Branchiostoma belcheri]|nr:hypothetical protein Bbelb_175410 [Branchiostoma belcheri]
MHKAQVVLRHLFKVSRDHQRQWQDRFCVEKFCVRSPAVNMSSDGSMEKMHPKDLRSLIRSGNMHGKCTSGMCKGRTQTNIAIVHKSLAQDFERFCQANAGPLPLLYMSKVGEYGAPPLAEDSDIRTDVSLYSVYRDGTLTEKAGDLSDFTEQLKDMVTFYVGCSFSFEDAAMSAGVPIRNVEQGVDVSMYQSNIPCHPVGDIKCEMFLSMRPIPEDKLEVAYRITHHMPDVHGAPIHIGDPTMIGISDLTAEHLGDDVEFQPGDVPVFWCCGVTTQPAVQSAKSSLAFTHSPGCMFVADVMATVPTTTASSADTPKVVQVSQEPLLYSAASELAVDQIQRLEKAIQADPGKRGISHLHIPGELLRCALALSHASSVAITTGFPCHTELTPPEENDGPPGAVAMAAMLQALGKQVTMVIDTNRLQLIRDIVEGCVQAGILQEPVAVLPYPPTNGTVPDRQVALQFLTHDGDISRPRYDHLVAIERVGRAADGTYRSMKAKDLSSLVSPIDQLFDVANEEIPGIKTTGIGDGGNELGMGRVQDRVHQFIPNGPQIACTVPADYTITAGVSNWGGWAIAAALYLLRACPIHDRYQRRAVGFPRDSTQLLGAVPSVEREEKVMSIMMKHSLRDGMTAELGMVVDGLQFATEHAQMMKNMRSVLSLD